MRRFTLVALLLVLVCGTTFAQNWATMGDTAVDPGNTITFRFAPTEVGIKIDVFFRDKNGDDVMPMMNMDLPIQIGENYVTGMGDMCIPFGLTYSGGTQMGFSVFVADLVGEDLSDSIDSPINIADFLGDITYMAFSGKGMGPNDGEWYEADPEKANTMLGGPVLWSINVGGTFNSNPSLGDPQFDMDGGTWIGYSNPMTDVYPWLNFGNLTEEDEWLGESFYGRTVYTQDMPAVMLSQGELFRIVGALAMPIGWEYVEITVGGRDIPFTATPEPATLLLLGVAAAGIPMIRRRKK
ncbi:MAG: PEP-CTERM sorting domain-containing protein [Thermoguttaceae bacterium]